VPAAGERRNRVTVGLLADPDTPTDLAQELAEELPELLAAKVDDSLEWVVEVHSSPFSAQTEDSGTLVSRIARRARREGWDVAIGLTELPIRAGGRPLVADASASQRAAVISLPALGGLRMRTRARAALLDLIRALYAGQHEVEAGAAKLARKWTGPFRTSSVDDELIDVRLVGTMARGRIRLLLGMVRSNRPWKLLPGLAKAMAAALATSAVATLNNTMWQVSDTLGTLRLLVAMVGSIALLVAWLIIDAELWERVEEPTPDQREKAWFYNASTVLTLVVGVGICYLGLLVLNLLLAAFVLRPVLLQQTFGHPVGVSNYFLLSWLVSTAATAGAALGSSLETDDAIRAAAYGRRERERRQDAIDDAADEAA
jgi:hypothetical protein